MTLRARLAVLTSAAVALAILIASVAAWLLVREQLMGEVDERLLERAPSVDRIARMTAELPPSALVATRNVRMVLENEPLGVQLVDPDGSVRRQIAPGDIDLAPDTKEGRLLDGGANGEQLRTVTIDGASYRVMSATLDNGGEIRLIHPLDGVQASMTRIAWLFMGVTGFGIAMAGGLGWFTARTGLQPVDRLVAAAEQVAATKDLAHRIDVSGNERHDEVNRLAASLNSMLGALDNARTQQRELVENAGHELRTPLATLRNDLGLLLRSEQHPDRDLPVEDRTRLLHDLEAEAAALSELVGELIDLARGEIEPESPIESDLLALVDRAVARSRRVNPQVTVNVRGTSLEAAVRPTTLERAIANLIRNAVQFSEASGVVEVVLSERNGWASIQVLDRGPGITDEDMPRLFDRFYRGVGARERHGSGLGLAIAAQAADAHGGTVEVENRPGGGAVFTLRVPVSSSAPAGS